MRRKLIYLISLTVMLGQVSNTSAELVTHWSFNEGSGTIAFDSSSNVYNGTLEGNPQWVDGKLGGALQFDGSDDYVHCGLIDIDTNITGGLTVCAWVNKPAGGDMKFCSNRQVANGPGGGFTCSIYNDRMEMDFTNASSRNLNRDSDGPTVTTDNWVHVSWVYDDVANTFNEYHNGVLADSSDENVSIGISTQEFRIGTDAPNLGYYVNGMIDDVCIFDHALSVQEILSVMEGGGIANLYASYPVPADADTDVSRDVVLSWDSGANARTHDVYFGTAFDDVNNADISNPLDVLTVQNQQQKTYAPGRLEFGQTYYWRIDEINNADPNSPWKGDVWSFTTETFTYSIPGEMITVTTSSYEEEKTPENTINGSGLDESGLLHSNISLGNMWLSNRDGNQPTWIKYEFDKVYKLHEMWVWNSNDSLEPLIGLGFKDVSIEYSLNGIDYTTLGTTHEFAQAPGTSDYAHNITIEFNGVGAKYVRLTVNSNWGSILNQYGLSEVRFFYIPVNSRNPDPDSGTIDVALDVTLGWRAGRKAAEHNVYFSDDMQGVIDGNAPATTVTDTTYGPLSLDLGKTYYWRVDEVNNVETPNIWQGNLWDFTTQEYFVVDDFEDYNDFEPDRIFDKWIDGYGIATNGSTIGYPNPDFAAGGHFVETGFVHEGAQSIPYFYDNSTAGNSEAIMTLSSLRDWTKNGVSTLSLWFRGNPEGFVEDPADTYTITASGTDIWGTADEFHYVFKQLSGPGSIVAKVESVENTDPWAKAGVMIRQTLDPGSKFAAVYITPENGCRFQARLIPAVDATSDTSVATAGQMAITAPYWVKIERDAAGNFNGYYSSDGTTWVAMSWNPQNIPMPPDVYIGLAVTSHNANTTCIAEISNVQTTGTVSPQIWTQQAIGVEMPSNDAEQMYVALNGSALVYNDNPDASQIDDWTQWNIDLQEFADQGVDLTNVNTITIGFGDRSNQQPSGSGLVYFDDIRLYPPPQPEALPEPEPEPVP